MIIARSLLSEVRFHCPDETSARQLAYIGADPEMPGTRLDSLEVNILDLGGGFYDFGPPHPTGPGTARHMVERAHMYLRDRLGAEAVGAALLHGASLIIEGRRCLVVAEKGSGKTTLMLVALQQGLAIEADEHVAVFPDHVLARPRTLRIKAGSLAFAAEFRERILSSPAIHDWNGNAIYSFAPRTDRVDWRIRPGPADAVVVLEPNHAGLTCVDRMSREQAFSRLLTHAFLPSSGRAPALGNLHRLASAAQCWKLRLGNPDRAIWHLRQILSRS